MLTGVCPIIAKSSVDLQGYYFPDLDVAHSGLGCETWQLPAGNSSLSRSLSRLFERPGEPLNRTRPGPASGPSNHQGEELADGARNSGMVWNVENRTEVVASGSDGWITPKPPLCLWDHATIPVQHDKLKYRPYLLHSRLSSTSQNADISNDFNGAWLHTYFINLLEAFW